MMTSLTQTQCTRFSRQLILPEVGGTGQLKLLEAKVLIVGAGGLGCPAAQYLAGAGVGTIGIVDDDVVDMSNLHRQICHEECSVGMSKVSSLASFVTKLNSSVNVIQHETRLSRQNAVGIITDFDVVIDCSDNVPTRYLINDACVILGKPLVSGSALRFEGQLSVFSQQLDDPCYRCIYPEPPDPSQVKTCSASGVMGFVCGVIGSLQAQEALKLLIGIPSISGSLLLYDGLDCSFRKIQLRKRRKDCACSQNPTDFSSFTDFSIDYKVNDCPSLSLQPSANDRLSVFQYQNMIEKGLPHLLIDVREKHEADITKIYTENYLNIPISALERPTELESSVKLIRNSLHDNLNSIVVICKRGNDSLKASKILLERLPGDVNIKDVMGGLFHFSDNVDSSILKY